MSADLRAKDSILQINNGCWLRIHVKRYTSFMAKSIVTIDFEAPLRDAKSQIIICIPKEESMKLPSRGQVSVIGKINGTEYKTVLEPDGRWSHWLRIDQGFLHELGIKVGEVAHVQLTTSNEWPEPVVPKDLAEALDKAPQAVKEKWHDITPMARWEWIRWINATLSHETHSVRIEKTISKLAGSHRRPCCFNLAACTDPELARGGELFLLQK